MNATEFLIDLESYAKKLSGRILAHDFIKLLASGNASGQAIENFVYEYYFVTTGFVRCVAYVAGNIPDDETRSILIANLWEEHGSGNLSGSHRTLFKKFASSVGVNDDMLRIASPRKFTQDYLDRMISLGRDHHFLVGLGALGPGTEYFTAPEYSAIADGLRKGGLRDDAVEFFTVHALWDDDHYSEIMKAIKPWVDSEANQDLVRFGTGAMIELELGFWDGMLSTTS